MLFHRSRVIWPALGLASLLILPGHVPAVLAQDAAPAAAPAEDPLVAVVNGVELRRSDVVASARDLPQAYQDQVDRIFPALVERLIDLTLLLQEGERRALQDDAEVKARVAAFEDQVIRETLLDREIEEKVTEEAVRARYDRFVEAYQPQPEIRARHILVGTEEEAKAIIAELDAGADFQAIAKERSTDTASGANGGDLGFFTPDQMVPEFSEAAVALEPGSHSKAPVESRFGWHVIKVEERRDSAPPSFEQARPEIEIQLKNEVVTALVNELRAAAQIEQMQQPAPAEGGEDAPAGD